MLAIGANAFFEVKQLKIDLSQMIYILRLK